MKIEWNAVTWYSKLLTALLFAGLFSFGAYVGREYAATGQGASASATVYYIQKEIPFLLTPIMLKASAAFQTVTKTSSNSKTNSPAAKSPAPSAKTPATTTATAPVATSTGVPFAQTTTTLATLPPVTPPVTPAPAVTPPPVTPPPVIPPVVTPPVVTPPSTPVNDPPAQAGEVRFTAYTTGYGWPDNTPPGGEVSDPVLHNSAGGTGTYADPITVAVGHTISGNKDTLDYPKGTKFYVPNLRRYFIVEDTCGDGNSPQNGPCHTGYQGHVWLDLWIGGQGANKNSVLSCEDDVTGLFLVIQDPAPNYAVVSGAVFNSSCAAQYGDAVISS